LERDSSSRGAVGFSRQPPYTSHQPPADQGAVLLLSVLLYRDCKIVRDTTGTAVAPRPSPAAKTSLQRRWRHATGPQVRARAGAVLLICSMRFRAKGRRRLSHRPL